MRNAESIKKVHAEVAETSAKNAEMVLRYPCLRPLRSSLRSLREPLLKKYMLLLYYQFLHKVSAAV